VTVMIWVAEATWPACVDAALAYSPAGAEFVLLHVAGGEAAAAEGAMSGLMGRGLGHHAAERWERASASASSELLRAAADRLGVPCEVRELHGRVERAVVLASDDATLLVVARDGDRTRLGPRSLGPATRFVVDHAPCPVLLVWPEPAPDVASIPPPPPHP
jgi:nucleotide-binding universal stress UspA family protein